MEQEETAEYYLELSKEPVRFEAVNQLTNVFFDDSNKDVFAVRSGGVMGVVVKRPDKEPLNFRMEDHGPVVSIKFSLDHKVLAVQRSNNSVEFMNFDGSTVEAEYSQTCKKNSSILGFVWTNPNTVAFITDHGVECYMVIPEKKSLKLLKTFSTTVQWFVWCAHNKIALLASAHGSNLQPVIISGGGVNKTPKVETEPGRMALERDVTVATLYGVTCILILRHQSGPQTAEVHVYMLNKPCFTPVKKHVLKLGLSGRFAVNVVDDLILVHHQASRSSKLFDIMLDGESDGNVRYHTAIAPAKPFKSASLAIPGLVEPQEHICELYSPNWVVFQPNIIIDAKLGCLWRIHLCLDELCTMITDLSTCTQVLLKRTDGKQVLLKILLDSIKQEKPPLYDLEKSFNYINAIYQTWIEDTIQNNTASPPSAPIPNKSDPPRVLIDQSDIYNEIFQKLDNDDELKKLEWVVICYMTSLSEFGIPAQHNINELIIITLARRKKFTTMQQILQYGVVVDSKPLACLLLSLSNMHSAAFQLALDMMQRINAKDEIQEVLLSECQIISALNLAKDTANPRKFLSAAENCKGDASLFHSVLYYFGNNPKFAAQFQKDERLLHFVERYNSIYMDKSGNV